MAYSLIALGSNLGDRAAQLRQAMAAIAQLPQTRLLSRSRMLETTPIGGPAGQPSFLNAAALVESSLSPEALLPRLLKIESQLGRERTERWAARSLDLDVLLYDQRIIVSPELTVPHPRMVYRPFVLEPAAEAAPWMVHAESVWTVRGLLDHLKHTAPSIAVAANSDAADELLARINALFDSAISRGAFPAADRPVISRRLAGGQQFPTPPKLLLAAGSAGDDPRERRRMLNLPPTGPVAWVASAPTSPVDEALAAVQAVWPALAE